MLEKEIEGMDKDSARRLRLFQAYLRSGQTLQSEEGEQFKIWSIGPKRVFAYGVDGSESPQRKSLAYLAREYAFIEEIYCKEREFRRI